MASMKEIIFVAFSLTRRGRSKSLPSDVPVADGLGLRHRFRGVVGHVRLLRRGTGAVPRLSHAERDAPDAGRARGLEGRRVRVDVHRATDAHGGDGGVRFFVKTPFHLLG